MEITINEMRAIVEDIAKQNNVNIIIHDEVDSSNLAALNISASPALFSIEDNSIHTNLNALYQLVHGDDVMAMSAIYHEIGHFATFYDIPKVYYHDYALKNVFMSIVQMYIMYAFEDIDMTQVVADTTLMYHEHVVEKSADKWAHLNVAEMIKFQFERVPSKHIPYLDREAFLNFKFTDDELEMAEKLTNGKNADEKSLEEASIRFFNSVITDKNLLKVLTNEKYREEVIEEYFNKVMESPQMKETMDEMMNILDGVINNATEAY